MSDTSPQPLPDIKWVFYRKPHVYLVTAKWLEGAPIVTTVNMSSDTARSKFARALVERDSRLALEDVIGFLATEAEKLVNAPPPVVPESTEVDMAATIRPEQIFLPEVCGGLAPALFSGADGPVVQWRLFLQWATGKRECVPFNPWLELGDGRRLMLHPSPMPTGPEACGRWSRAARSEWLGGATFHPRAVFDDICRAIDEFIEFPVADAKGATETIALWIMLTYMYRAWTVVPYLYVGGPMDSGKTVLLEIIEQLAFRPIVSASISPSVLFREIDAGGGTLIYDEAESLKGKHGNENDLMPLLLAGYKASGRATRSEPGPEGKGWVPKSFGVYGPKVLACIMGLPPTLASRAITIRMFRAPKGCRKTKLRVAAHSEKWARLRDALQGLALEHGQAIRKCAADSSACPESLYSRNFELWQPLLSLAKWIEASGTVPGLHSMCVAFADQRVAESAEDSKTESDEEFMAILADHLRQGKHPSASEILETAKEQTPSTYDRWTPSGVGHRLRQYRIRSHKSNGRREYRRDSEPQLRIVQSTYGFDLGYPPESLSHVSQVSLTSGNITKSSDTTGTHGTLGTGPPGDALHPDDDNEEVTWTK